MNDSCERCRVRDFWDIGDVDKYFFKVMLGDFRHQMTIPHKFVRRFRKKIQGTVKIKVCNGNTCNVVVANYPNKLVLEGGWGTFVSTHNIRLGDFLVFRYNGNFQFEVLIFDTSCCVKESSNVAGNICYHVQQRHRDLIEISSDSDDHQPMKSARSEEPTPIQKKGSNQCNKMNISLPTSHLSLFGNNRTHTITHLTPMQSMKVEKKVRAVCPDIPMFGTVMTKSNITRHPCYLGFCKKYANQFLPWEDQIGKLQLNGKLWQVQFRITNKNLRRLSVGWKEFVSDNRLQIGDICLFELLKNKMRLTMNVHIVRK
ncbi:putative B3 domain-containing protein Os03g0621600 [Phragmites australis]|uniref:putative B3 domain-containing protein Os03g0621600 n=1 Tax=Phragmites australis TaxID=29695 RepID=UPI002D777AC1|nr:putative B3 domain-containing protein Os03g0621600 [Phragmites australis]